MNEVPIMWISVFSVLVEGNPVEPEYVPDYIAEIWFCLWISDRKPPCSDCSVYFSFVFMSYMVICCMLAELKDPSSVQLRPIKDSCVYLCGWGPCRPHRKVHSLGLFPAVWCQNYTHHPSESLEEDGDRIWAAQEPSKASLKKTKTETLISCPKDNRGRCFCEWKDLLA